MTRVGSHDLVLCLSQELGLCSRQLTRIQVLEERPRGWRHAFRAWAKEVLLGDQNLDVDGFEDPLDFAWVDELSVKPRDDADEWPASLLERTYALTQTFKAGHGETVAVEVLEHFVGSRAACRWDSVRARAQASPGLTTWAYM